MSNFDFSLPTRQSVKGIFVLLFLSFFKLIKSLYLVLIIFVFRFISDPSKFEKIAVYIVPVLVLLVLWMLIFNFLKFKNFKFHIKNNQFILSEGILHKKHTVLAFSKIQNINIKQNILHQILNVVQLDIDTAGDTDTEISIAALDTEKALALKEILLGSDTIKTEVTDNEIVKISAMTLFLVGVTENHFKSLMLLLAACIGLFSDAEDFLEAIGQQELYANLENNVFGFEVGSYIIPIIAALLLVVISIVYSIVSIFIRNFNLTVTSEKDKIEIHKGLFNKVSYALSLDKVQSVHYETNFFKNKLNLYNLKIFQAMPTKKSKKNIEIVGIQKSELKFIEGLLFNKNPLKNGIKQKPNKYYLTQLLFSSLAILVVVTSWGLFVFGTKILLLLIVIIPIVFLLVFATYKKSYYKFLKEHIVLGSGSVSTLTSIIENHKIQTVNINQNFFQKRKGVVDLNIFVASTKITLPCVAYNKAIKLYNYLLFYVESSTKEWI